MLSSPARRPIMGPMPSWLVLLTRLLTWVAQLLEDAITPPQTEPPTAGEVAIVSLGYRLHEQTCEPSELLAQRITVASALADRPLFSRRRTLVFSGGVGKGLNCSEAAAMLAHRRQSQTPLGWRMLQPRILLEDQSRSTRENALLTVRLLTAAAQQSAKKTTLVVVTNRFHQRRACATFRAAARETALLVACAPTPPSLAAAARETGSSGGSLRLALAVEVLWLVLREPAAYALYYARGWMAHGTTSSFDRSVAT